MADKVDHVRKIMGLPSMNEMRHFETKLRRDRGAKRAMRISVAARRAERHVNLKSRI